MPKEEKYLKLEKSLFVARVVVGTDIESCVSIDFKSNSVLKLLRNIEFKLLKDKQDLFTQKELDNVRNQIRHSERKRKEKKAFFKFNSNEDALIEKQGVVILISKYS